MFHARVTEQGERGGWRPRFANTVQRLPAFRHTGVAFVVQVFPGHQEERTGAGWLDTAEEQRSSKLTGVDVKARSACCIVGKIIRMKV
jgi:hypothetical protein